ncbi:hypothetical protein M569_05662, partial [Genlisea aurea]
VDRSDSSPSPSSRITHHARLGQIGAARKYFDDLPVKTIASWNSLVSCYFANGRPTEARNLFDEMPERSTVSWNALISGYVKNGMIAEARKAFDEMPHRNVVSWTSMLRGHVEGGSLSEAQALFRRMPHKNVVSWTVMLGGLIDHGRIRDAENLYRQMPAKDAVAETSMICGLCSDGRVDEAREIFDGMRFRSVVSWTSMISGYTHNGKVDVARKLFEVMPERNEVTWTAMLTGYAQCGRTDEAWRLFNAMEVESPVASSAMILALGENGDVSRARDVFDLTADKDEGTWSAMIKTYERKGYETEALSLFRDMQQQAEWTATTTTVKPNFPSLISALAVCASLASLDPGKQIHGRILRSGLDGDVFLSSVLTTMYMKCGDVAKAGIVFEAYRGERDAAMWNAMITGYAQHGLGDEALRVFDRMPSSRIQPDSVTFVGILSACSYSGKVDEGRAIFATMKPKYGIEPSTEHYACLVDLLGRAGLLNEALQTINGMPVEADAIVWGSLMGACRSHVNSDMGEVAADRLLRLEPHNAGPFVLLSHIYASKGRWGDVARLRRNMRNHRITKSPGCSWIEVDKRVHMFTGGESRPHPEHEQIVRKWDELNSMIKEEGYRPDGAFALHDVDEEEKVQNLRNHSEKLAVAYGIMKLVPRGAAVIRVMKNLRVCGDCHSAIKLVSKVIGREIVLRDANRFHHFKDGSCSCKDFWIDSPPFASIPGVIMSVHRAQVVLLWNHMESRTAVVDLEVEWTIRPVLRSNFQISSPSAPPSPDFKNNNNE